MTHERISSLDHEHGVLPSDAHVTWIKPSREIVARSTRAIHELGVFALLVILSAEESAKHIALLVILAAKSLQHRPELPQGYAEQLRDYDYWVD